MNAGEQFMQGRINVTTPSSVLISSSKYLNHPSLRNWVAQEMLRRNGTDYPATYAIPELVTILLELQNRDEIEAMFTKARKSWPELDRWFEEAHVSTYTKADLAKHPEGSLGNKLYRYLTEWNLELDLSTHNEFQGQYGYFMLRAGQQHDIEHLLGGAGYDALGEAIPNYMRLASFLKYFEPDLVREIFLVQHFLINTALSRTLLHYPETFAAFWERLTVGTTVGNQSGPFFLQKYEDYFDLSVEEAREKIGIVGAVNRDTTALSDIWMEGALSAQFAGKPIPNVLMTEG